MEDSTFSIRSTSTAKELRFFDADDHNFSVELRGTEIYAVQKIYCPLGSSEFGQFFLRLASHERPWPGTEECASLEGDFSISARCSTLGVVTFSISIHGLFGVPEEWQLSSILTSELGQLPKIAAASSRFFGVVAGT